MNNHNLVMWKLAEKGEYERLHKYIGKLRPLEKRPAQAVDAEFDP